MHCSVCGQENPEGARFCASCGSPLERTCPSCGASLPADAGFCPACGTKLEAMVVERFGIDHATLQVDHVGSHSGVPVEIGERFRREAPLG